MAKMTTKSWTIVGAIGNLILVALNLINLVKHW